jgi:hypothetical protein
MQWGISEKEFLRILGTDAPVKQARTSEEPGKCHAKSFDVRATTTLQLLTIF